MVERRFHTHRSNSLCGSQGDTEADGSSLPPASARQNGTEGFPRPLPIPPMSRSELRSCPYSSCLFMFHRCLGPEHDLKLPPCVWFVRGFAACARRIFNRFLITVFFNTSDRVHGGVRIRIGCISVAQQSSRRPRNGATLEALTDGWNLPNRVSANGGSRSSLNLCLGAHTGGWAAQWNLHYEQERPQGVAAGGPQERGGPDGVRGVYLRTLHNMRRVVLAAAQRRSSPLAHPRSPQTTASELYYLKHQRSCACCSRGKGSSHHMPQSVTQSLFEALGWSQSAEQRFIGVANLVRLYAHTAAAGA